MTPSFPLPFTCGHKAFKPGATNAHGNPALEWEDPVDVACVWWTPTSAEPNFSPTGGGPAVVYAYLVVDAQLTVDHRDRFVIGDIDYDVIGLPRDYNHGPWARPDRLLIELKAVV